MTGARASETETGGAGLDALRGEIDRIDASLHALLMERGEIIDRLIAVKARAGGGSAFRPAREAAMMRRLVERHRGLLPLAAVESIWRIIISTFTYVQAPYAVHADVSGGDAAMRDACRFHFGFTVPLRTHASPAGVIAAVAEAKGDLGVIRCGGARDAGACPWWDELRPPAAPKIIARLPFVERADHAAGLPLFVIARSQAEPSAETAPREVRLHAVTLPGGINDLRVASPLAVVDQVATPAGAAVLVAAPDTLATAALAEAIAAAAQVDAVRDPVPVGSQSSRYEVEQLPLAAQ